MGIFRPNTAMLDNFYDKGKFTLAWRLCLLFGCVFLLLTIAFIKSTIEEIATYATCTLISISSLIYLAKTKNYKPAYYFLAISGTLIAMYTLLTFRTVIHYGDFLWIILIIIFSFFGLGIKHGLFFLLVNLCTIIYYCLFVVNLNISSLLVLSEEAVISLIVELVAATLSISYVVYQFIIFHDYSYKSLLMANKELQDRNDVISNQNNEKTTLVKEVHHRVKNNLQIIVSLLRMHKSDLKTEEAKKHFNEAINRIMTMSLIHQKLYQEKELSHINLKGYIEDLSSEAKIVSIGDFPIDINIKTDVESVGLKTIVPLGLLINELLSNSFKYAFKNRDSGKIEVAICQQGKDYSIEYSDNGTWIEPDEEYVGFGLELIDILTDQLEGTVKRKIINEQTTYSFTLKNLDLK